MQAAEIRWNDEARAKILDDSDRVLREAVVGLAGTMSGTDADEIYSALYARLKDRFIDFEPGPDIRKFAEAIAKGEITDDHGTDGGEADIEVNDG
jgi:hypothetical protein